MNKIGLWWAWKFGPKSVLKTHFKKQSIDLNWKSSVKKKKRTQTLTPPLLKQLFKIYGFVSYEDSKISNKKRTQLVLPINSWFWSESKNYSVLMAQQVVVALTKKCELKMIRCDMLGQTAQQDFVMPLQPERHGDKLILNDFRSRGLPCTFENVLPCWVACNLIWSPSQAGQMNLVIFRDARELTDLTEVNVLDSL